jgi:hypothetical protein
MGLYQVLYWPKEAAAAGHSSEPWAVVNLETRTVNGRWHTTQADALAQARALYARLGDKAKVHSDNGNGVLNAFFCFADTATIPDSGLAYIEAIAAKTYQTPAYGSVEVTDQKIQNFITNFHTNTRGQEIAINYDHGVDVAKGNKAAGWIRDARKSADGKLVLGVEFTEPAKQELKNKEWRYFSLEWEDEWTNNEGTVYTDVMVGGGLTNRPIAKGLMPINFSEIFVESLDAEKQFAVWSTAYVNSLPDSSFAWIGPDKQRHLPYKDKDGKIDLPHVRNMLARVNQVNGIPPAVVARVKALGARLLGKAGSNMSEFDFSEDQLNLIFALSDAVLIPEVTNESVEWEHSEPGTGPTPIIGNPEQPDPGTGQPVPRKQGDPSKEDPAIGGGWRRETPPIADPNDPAYDPSQWVKTNFGKNPKGGNKVPFELEDNTAHELLRVLELPVESDGAKVLETTKLAMGELAQFKHNQDRTEQEKKFAEQYPDMYHEHNKLMERDRKSNARLFSESVGKLRTQRGLGLVETRTGLSQIAKEKVEEVHVKFAEGTATSEDYESAVRAIMNGGLVDFGEIGSNNNDDSIPVFDTNTPSGVAGSKKAMSELMQKYMKENNCSPDEALKAVQDKHPDLAQAAATAIPG